MRQRRCHNAAPVKGFRHKAAFPGGDSSLQLPDIRRTLHCGVARHCSCACLAARRLSSQPRSSKWLRSL